jgi:hypothetical protein
LTIALLARHRRRVSRTNAARITSRWRANVVRSSAKPNWTVKLGDVYAVIDEPWTASGSTPEPWRALEAPRAARSGACSGCTDGPAGQIVRRRAARASGVGAIETLDMRRCRYVREI